MVAGIVCAAALLLCMLGARCIYEVTHFKVVRYTVASEKIGRDGQKKSFVFLSDLHNKEYGKNNETLLQAVRKADPDFVIVGGDMLVARPGRDFTAALTFMKALSAEFTVYCANGNHEYRLKIYQDRYPSMYEKYTWELKQAGVLLLENEIVKVSFEDGTKDIAVCGLEIAPAFYKRRKKTTMPASYVETVVGEKPEEFTLLLAHNPLYFPQYAAWGAEITCSGHLHGGIVRIPGIGGLVSPQIELFPKYDSGFFERDGCHLVLSSGLGTHTINVRLFNPAQLIVVVLEGKGR